MTNQQDTHADKEEKLIAVIREKLREIRRQNITGEIVAKAETARGGIVKSFVGVTEAVY